MLTAGLGRPLVVTILDQPASMRVLAGDRRPRVVLAAWALALALGLFASALVALAIG